MTTALDDDHVVGGYKQLLQGVVGAGRALQLPPVAEEGDILSLRETHERGHEFLEHGEQRLWGEQDHVSDASLWRRQSEIQVGHGHRWKGAFVASGVFFLLVRHGRQATSKTEFLNF